jgi:hypothetical protein
LYCPINSGNRFFVFVAVASRVEAEGLFSGMDKVIIYGDNVREVVRNWLDIRKIIDTVIRAGHGKYPFAGNIGKHKKYR